MGAIGLESLSKNTIVGYELIPKYLEKSCEELRILPLLKLGLP